MANTRRVWSLTSSSQAASAPFRHRSTRLASRSKAVPVFACSTRPGYGFAHSHLATASCTAAAIYLRSSLPFAVLGPDPRVLVAGSSFQLVERGFMIRSSLKSKIYESIVVGGRWAVGGRRWAVG